MGLWNHAAKVAIGILVGAAFMVVAAYFGVTLLASVAWLKAEHDFWTAPLKISRWGVWLWAVVSIVVLAVLVLRGVLAVWASPYRAYVGDYMNGLIWEWDFNTKYEPVNLCLFCIKCFHQFGDSDFKYTTPGDPSAGYKLICDHCTHTVAVPSSGELYKKVIAEIKRKVKAREWKRYKGKLPR